MAIDKVKKMTVSEDKASVKEEEAEKELTAAENTDTEDNEEETEAKDAEESEEEAGEESEEEEETKPKAKKDPVPAVMIVLIYAIIISAVLYYFLPTALTPSFGYTLDQFNANLAQSDISKRMAAQYTTLIPQFKLVDKNSIKEIWSIKGEVSPEEQKRLDARFKPFVKTYAATEELEHILVEANTRINDGQLTRMCIYCTYDNQHLSMMMVHFGAVLGNYFPGMTFNEAVSLIMNYPFGSDSSASYVVKGDIAYRIIADNVGGKQTYIKLEILPAKAVKPEQIMASAPSETTAAASETTAATTTAPAA